MTLPDAVKSALEEIIVAISASEFDQALALTNASRCSTVDITRVFAEYGATFQAPPFSSWDVVQLSTIGHVEGWSVRVPLWSFDEGGRSDLEVRFTVETRTSGFFIELDDILVP